MTRGRHLVRIRRVVFWLFALIYVVAVPFLIMYAFGKPPRVALTPSRVTTGALHVVTRPSGATTVINDRRRPDETPITMNGVRSGAYNIRLEKTGFQPWSGTVTVRPDQVAPDGRLLLLPDHLDVHPVISEPVQQVLPLIESGYIVVLPRSRDDLYFYGLSDRSLISVRRELHITGAAESIASIHRTQAFPGLIVKVQGPQIRYYLIDFRGVGYEFRNLTPTILRDTTALSSLPGMGAVSPDETAADIAWVSATDETIYFQSGSSLVEIRGSDSGGIFGVSAIAGVTTETSNDSTVLHGVDAVGEVGQSYYLIDGSHLLRITRAGRAEDVRTVPALPGDGSNPGTVVFVDRKRIIVHDSDGTLLYLDGEGGDWARLGNAQGVALSRDESRLFVWSGDNIGFVPLVSATIPIDPNSGAAPPELVWATTAAGDVRTVEEIPDFAQAIVATQDALYVSPVSSEVRGTQVRLAGHRDDTPVVFDPLWGVVYFVTTDNATFVSSRLIPVELDLDLK